LYVYTYKGTIIQKSNEITNVDIEFKGEWKDYKGSQQFCFSSYLIKQDYSDYFLENMVVGLSKKAITDIKLKCGKNFESIIEENPKLLLKIKGVGEKTLEKIVRSFKENKHLKSLAEFLLPFGVTNNAIKRIYDTYGTNGVEVVKENPYTLVEMRGVSFKKADDIALKIGVSESSDFRISAGIKFAIEDYLISAGHTCIKIENYYEKAKEILNTESFELDYTSFTNKITFLKETDVLKSIGLDLITTINFYNMEKYIFDTLNKIKNVKKGPLIQNIDKYIEEKENKLNIKLDEKQKDAITLVNLQYRGIYLAGYAGTGKSTSSKTSLDIYAETFGISSVVGCALSGIAAKRIENVTGYKSYTIHTLLGYRGGNDFEFNEENKLQYSIIMIDEGSMVDTYLFYKLLKAVDFETTVLLIAGDPSQLKSVSPGNVFENIIDKKLLYGITLEKVFRQSEEQIINVFATNYIRKGLVPEDYKNNFEDFQFISHSFNSFKLKNSLSKEAYAEKVKENKMAMTEDIKRIASQYLYTLGYWKKDIWKYITEFQIITPMKGNLLGAEHLNEVVQGIFNPNAIGDELEVFNKKFRFRDKVIHLKNQNMHVLSTHDFKEKLNSNTLKSVLDENHSTSTRKVFNGQLGVIVNINLEDNIVSVYYPNEGYVALYKSENFKQRNIDLAYAITIHKAQGSEYENMIIPMTSSHFIMLNNNLLYTAVTRAKKKLYVVGESYAFEHGCKNKQNVKRFTVLENL
jgi:exodeoxyribonuclease V alpha subunit